MELFKSADKNGDGCLNLKEIVGLMKTLNIEVDLDTAKDIFQVSAGNTHTHHITVYTSTRASPSCVEVANCETLCAALLISG